MSRTIPQGQVFANPGGLPAYTAGEFVGLSIDEQGRLIVTSGGGAITAVVSGSHTPADGYANPTDAINSFSLLGGWNGASWDRLRTGDAAESASGYTAPSVALKTMTQAFFRVQGAGYMAPYPGIAIADGLSLSETAPYGISALVGYNGATWDRLGTTTLSGGSINTSLPGLQTASLSFGVHSSGPTVPMRLDQAADTLANPPIALDVLAFNLGWNGTTWDRLRAKVEGGTNIPDGAIGLVTNSQLYAYETVRDEVHALSLAYDMGSSAQSALRVMQTPPAGADIDVLSPVVHSATYAAGAGVAGLIAGQTGRLFSIDVREETPPS